MLQEVRRAADLYSFRDLDFHPLRGNRQGQYALRLSGQMRMIVTVEDEQSVIKRWSTTMTSTAKRIETDLAIHPGELLAGEIEAREMTPRALAEAMGRQVRLVNDSIRGKRAITAEIALDLERALGTPAYIWVGLQGDYELTVARNIRTKPS